MSCLNLNIVHTKKISKLDPKEKHANTGITITVC